MLLSGSGHTAHVYDEFALKLKDCCHVYGITRRGYGASSIPETGYDEPSLSNDVWTVIQTLGLKAPVLIGHSMAGAELTGVGMLHSDRLGGLVYLDALGDSTDDPPDDPTWKALQAKLPPSGPPPACTSDRSSFAAFRAFLQCRHGIAIPEGDLRQGFETAADGSVGAARSPGWVSRAIGTGRPARDYSKIKVPVLAISDAVDFDLSHLKPEQPQPRNDEERALLIAFGKATQAVFDRWSANLKRGVPDAKVVDMPGATHYLWMTREADVLREIRAFIASLKRAPLTPGSNRGPSRPIIDPWRRATSGRGAGARGVLSTAAVAQAPTVRREHAASRARRRYVDAGAARDVAAAGPASTATCAARHGAVRPCVQCRRAAARLRRVLGLAPALFDRSSWPTRARCCGRPTRSIHVYERATVHAVRGSCSPRAKPAWTSRTRRRPSVSATSSRTGPLPLRRPRSGSPTSTMTLQGHPRWRSRAATTSAPASGAS